MQDSEGFADIENSDDEASPPEELPESMLKQVHAYFDLHLTTESMPDYMEWDELDAPDKNNELRGKDLNEEKVIQTNILFACRYMIRGWTCLFDLPIRFPYESVEMAIRMFVFEMLIWCNMFCRMLHIDFIHLFTGVDTLDLRKYIDGDLDTDNTAPFIAFLEEHRGPFRNMDLNCNVIYPNAWLADKWKRLMSEIGAGFQHVRWCSRHERRF